MLRAVSLAITIASLISFGGLAACEKTDHETIDKWMNTQKGPEKLKKAFLDEGVAADLSAHAAANMLKKGRDGEVKSGLETLSPGRRAELISKLAPLLWEVARVEDESHLPKSEQISAKDALVTIRTFADPTTTQTIDGYLIDWYCVASYEGRANAGGVIGPKVLRMIGPAAAKKLISVANGVIAAPKNKVGDELLLALAVTGSPDAVKYVLDVAIMDRADKTLPDRATDALHRAYVTPDGLFDVTPPDALVPHLGTLTAMVKDEKTPGHAANNAVGLIRAIGAPACIAPLVDMLGYPHRDESFTYMAAQNALVCGGTKAIGQVVRALPEGTYEQAAVVGSIVKPLSKLSPATQVTATLRELLTDKKAIVRWVSIEALAELKSKVDAPAIAALAKDGTKLVGYWGDQSRFEPAARKADPTLGARAKELAGQLTK